MVRRKTGPVGEKTGDAAHTRRIAGALSRSKAGGPISGIVWNNAVKVGLGLPGTVLHQAR